MIWKIKEHYFVTESTHKWKKQNIFLRFDCFDDEQCTIKQQWTIKIMLKHSCSTISSCHMGIKMKQIFILDELF